MKTIFFFVLSCVFLFAFLSLFGTENFHSISLISLVSSILIINFLGEKSIETDKFNIIKNNYHRILNGKIVLLIIIANALINIINVIYISDMVTFELETQKTIFRYVPIATVVIAQIGGWFLQAVLIFILAELLGASKPFSYYLKILGFSYIGFLISSIIGFIYNLSVIERGISVSKLQSIVYGRMEHIILGKYGEYLTLSIAAYLIYLSDNLSEKKSLTISIIPSIVVLTVYQFFTKYVI
ncbi:hypothetical protein CAPN010_07980 [Capnocytophaga cynodegmi]|uniref:hypothetical protein n=1 Tax=Capnocytophaga cynodegmi TaxID=28189 RepID=UPI001EE2ACD9|nr:hypothetical protein [Capnocytophaga cynodegmi]GJQ06640.1 hypothetical protein CAPN010_07980 [Capnocytophaga cynodegmi]